ncbi:hypothetical protein [Leuconostoc pseudomesenteroides]|uniref:hypothetical protein n=1 Tax=Leuconostoc pseudomesenteroides TaxID=33968 RepID=UPI0039EA7EA3
MLIYYGIIPFNKRKRQYYDVRSAMVSINKNYPITLTRKEIKEAEVILAQYPFFGFIEKQRIDEIKKFSSELDENVGGGRSSSSDNHAHENTAIRNADDKTINQIKHNRAVIEKMLSGLEEYEYRIISLSYFQRFNKPNLRSIANNTSVSISTVIRFRKKFITYLYPLLET